MDIKEFEECKSFSFDFDKHWSVLKTFQVILSKLKYQNYPHTLTHSIINNKYTLTFVDYCSNNSIDVTFPKCNDELNILSNKYNISLTLKFKTHIDKLSSKLNNFKYYRLYNDTINYPLTSIINEYSLCVRAIVLQTDQTTNQTTNQIIDVYTNKINKLHMNYFKFVQIHNSDVLLLLTWIFNKSNKFKYNFNTVSKMSNKFDFLLDNNSLMNDKKEIIDIFYTFCDTIYCDNSKTYYHSIKVQDIVLIMHNNNILIKLNTFVIFNGNYKTRLLRFKYMDDVKFQLLVDYLINNNYQQKLEEGLNKYIFKNII